MPTDRARRPREDPPFVRWTLTVTAVIVVGLLVVVPVANVFVEALRDGVGAYWRNLAEDADTRDSILLTLTVVPIVLVANVVFGMAAAWAACRFDFRFRSVFVALIDLPFAVSPVVAGLMFVLVFGLQGYLGDFLRRDGYAIMPWVTALLAVLAYFIVYLVVSKPRRRRRWLWLGGGVALFVVLLVAQQKLGIWPEHRSLKIIFATPGLVLATSFVTFPFVARELIPVMDAVGVEEELAAASLGANGWQMFWHVTVPNVRWGLFYGIILCNARAMGEFGAVHVVSGHIAGQTDTMPLRIEKLFQEYNLSGSFAVASLLTLVAIGTLALKARVERALPQGGHR